MKVSPEIPEPKKEEPTLDSIEKQIQDLHEKMTKNVLDYVETTEKILEVQNQKKNISLIEVAHTSEHLQEMRKIVNPH